MVRRTLAENPSLKVRLVNTVPMGRLGTPADVANYAAFLCSDRAGFVTGTLAVIDGGKTIY